MDLEDIWLEIFKNLNLQFVKTKLSIVSYQFNKIDLNNFRLVNDINLKTLINLTSFNLEDNQIITDQGVKNLINLTSLNLEDNQIITDQVRW